MAVRFIYGLFDPGFPDDIRYVGQSADLPLRMSQHAYDAKQSTDTIRSIWIRDVWLMGREPHHKILAEVCHADEKECRTLSDSAEFEWIKKLSNSAPIVNAPYWERSMRARGVPRCVIALYRSNMRYYSVFCHGSEERRDEAHAALLEIQRDFPELFFRTVEILEFFSLTPVTQSYNVQTVR